MTAAFLPPSKPATPILDHIPSPDDTPTEPTASISVDELLSLLLAPDLSVYLTPEALLHATSEALFTVLPLLLAALQQIGEESANRQKFTRLVSAFHLRVLENRVLKLRFMLLAHHPAFSSHWVIRMVYRNSPYHAAKLALIARRSLSVQQQPSLGPTDTLKSQAPILPNVTPRSPSLKVEQWRVSPRTLASFAVNNLFHPLRGVQVRDHQWHFRVVRNSFTATELVDSIMEHANYESRSQAVRIAQKLLDNRLIHPVASQAQTFTDSNRLYQSRIVTNNRDQRHACIVTKSGDQISCWDEFCRRQEEPYRSVELKIPMDIVDLQSLDFWSSSVFVKNVNKGYSYGYRVIAHPLRIQYADPTVPPVAPQDRLANDLSLGAPAIPQNGRKERFETIAGVPLPPVSRIRSIESESSTTSSTLGDDLINYASMARTVQGPDSCVAAGDIVVRKVFSSIARPMILELRQMAEDSDLGHQPDQQVLGPGVLVKEGTVGLLQAHVSTLFLTLAKLF